MEVDVTVATSTTGVGSGRAAPLRTSVPAEGLAIFVVAVLALQQLLLWSFLGLASWLLLAGAVAFALLGLALHRLGCLTIRAAVDVRLIAACFVISLLIFVLGGEGRFFYANTDWQVRNAVLHDLVTYPWPFAYSLKGEVDILRAPLGLYLVPALVGKAGGLRAAELTMLVQSALLLTCILAMGSSLFETRRERVVSLLVFLIFSGMDVLGMTWAGGRLGMHLEGWGPLQYSSDITLAFWVPMHALAGWIGAVLFLLWRTDRLSLTGLLTPLPLLALLSPLALIGMVPFAAFAGIIVLRSRALRVADVALPLASLLLSVPSLLYLASGSGAVGLQETELSFEQWALFEALEVIPYMLAALLVSRSSRFGSFTPLLVVLVLLVLPFAQIGSSGDLTMRASIPALAILSLLVAEFLMKPQSGVEARMIRGIATAALVIGSLTPLTEIIHAVERPRQPPSSCSFFGVVPGGTPTYDTQLARMARPVAPSSPALVSPKDPPSCRQISWYEAEQRYYRPLFEWGD
jgi:hypothetical protein